MTGGWYLVWVYRGSRQRKVDCETEFLRVTDFTKKSMATDVPMLKPIQVFTRHDVQ
jgi:hypothetical protein